MTTSRDETRAGCRHFVSLRHWDDTQIVHKVLAPRVLETHANQGITEGF